MKNSLMELNGIFEQSEEILLNSNIGQLRSYSLKSRMKKKECYRHMRHHWASQQTHNESLRRRRERESNRKTSWINGSPKLPTFGKKHLCTLPRSTINSQIEYNERNPHIDITLTNCQ